mmetsp:Transcript_136268/g.339807  ORF Transcript_136268/g.339807 Transcript_136268/m.339807 type:complete len:430 (+) Transcript_136268:52-1341(+)
MSPSMGSCYQHDLLPVGYVSKDRSTPPSLLAATLEPADAAQLVSVDQAPSHGCCAGCNSGSFAAMALISRLPMIADLYAENSAAQWASYLPKAVQANAAALRVGRAACKTAGQVHMAQAGDFSPLPGIRLKRRHEAEDGAGPSRSNRTPQGVHAIGASTVCSGRQDSDGCSTTQTEDRMGPWWSGHVWTGARDPSGSLLLQAVWEGPLSSEDQKAFIAEFRGHVAEGLRCPNANYLLQKVISSCDHDLLWPIINEITGKGHRSVAHVACHKYGCRIIQRLIEHCPGEQMRSLVEILFEEFLDISRHAYGNFVVQNLLQHLAQDQRSRLVELVEKHVLELASHQHGCAVLGAALEHGDLADKCRLAEMVLEDSDQVSFMAGTKHGRSIITNLLHALDGTGCRRLLALLEGNLKLEEVLQCRSEEGTCTSC